MAQIQLYLSKSQKGFSSLGNINPSEDVARHIHDFSPALQSIDYDTSVLQVFYLISYIDEGLLFTILRPIIGNGGGYYAATLFLPTGIKIPTEKFIEIVGDIRKEVEKCQDPGTETMGELRRLLSQDFALDTTLTHFTASSGHNYAFARTGGSNPSLADYYNERFYQPEYADFAGVLLIDSNDKTSGRNGAADLTGKFRKMLTVKPPRQSPEGFTPSVGRIPFRRAIMAGKGDVLDIVWRRSGFETVNQKYTVEKDGDTVPQCDTSVARKIIAPSTFYVSEQNSRKNIAEFEVSVNGTPITGPTPFPFDKLVQADVEIKAPGYFDFKSKMDLASTAQALVQLRKLHKSYRFDMPLVTPEPLEPLRIHIKTLKPLNGCPIEGYEVAGDTVLEGGTPNSLYYVGKTGKRNTYYIVGAAIAGLLLGFIIGAIIFYGIGKKQAPAPAVEQISVIQHVPAAAPVPDTVVPAPATTDTIAPAAVSEPIAAPAPKPAAELTAADYQTAVEYLNSHKVWNKQEMEAIPALAGLYADLNDYNFERIKGFWAEKLDDSKSFKAVVAAVEGSATKRNPRTGKHDPTYNPADDEAINWRSYTYWVDP